MEKITDNDLKAMLTKNEETSKEIKNKDTEETQWVEISKEEAKEAFNNAINATIDENSSLQESLEQEIDFNTIPEVVEDGYEEKPLDPVIEQREKLTIGLTPEDIQAFFNYISGKGEKPDFVDRFMADAEGRVKEMTMIMNLIQLSQIPTDAALVNQLTERLYEPTNFYDIEACKDIIATRSAVKKDINNTIDIALKSIQTTNQFGSLNNEYRKLLDSVMMLPADKLKLIRGTVLEAEKKLEEK